MARAKRARVCLTRYERMFSRSGLARGRGVATNATRWSPISGEEKERTAPRAHALTSRSQADLLDRETYPALTRTTRTPLRRRLS